MSVGPTPSTVPAWSEDLLTSRAKVVWNGGDFHPIARSFERGAREFVDRLGLGRGEWVLDVACGTGNLALPAARTGATVTGIDIAANQVAMAQLGARNAGCNIHFDVGNVEAMPYATDQFDTTMSMFGAMFAYRPELAAAELLRVTRRGGRIALANWMPDGLAGKILRAHAAVVPPAADLPSPLEWGVEDLVVRWFGNGVSSLRGTPRTIELSFPLGPANVTELFATCYGPTVAALKSAGTVRGQVLRDGLTVLFDEENIATDGTTTLVGEYLEVLAIVA
jgi:SAM-dependent methyltransferase